MKYKLILLFFLASCSSYSTSNSNKSGYFASGFAYIENKIPSNYVNDKFFISHNKLNVGTKLKITNPENKKSLEAVIKRKVNYDDFYKVLISRKIVEELELSFEFPFVEVNEIKTNKSFIAKKAITDNAEKKIANNAPIDQIDINNISQKKKNIQKVKSYSILVADFYSLESAKILKNKLALILANSNYHLIYINKKNESSYELLLGPYNTINKLKNDYIVLSDSSFEDLDIKINE